MEKKSAFLFVYTVLLFATCEAIFQAQFLESSSCMRCDGCYYYIVLIRSCGLFDISESGNGREILSAPIIVQPLYVLVDVRICVIWVVALMTRN